MQALAERVAALKSELDTDPGQQEQQRKKRALQAAEQLTTTTVGWGGRGLSGIRG